MIICCRTWRLLIRFYQNLKASELTWELQKNIATERDILV